MAKKSISIREEAMALPDGQMTLEHIVEIIESRLAKRRAEFTRWLIGVIIGLFGSYLFVGFWAPQTARDAVKAAAPNTASNPVQGTQDIRSAAGDQQIDPILTPGGELTLELDEDGNAIISLPIATQGEISLEAKGQRGIDAFMALYNIEDPLSPVATNDDCDEDTLNSCINENLDVGLYVIGVRDFWGNSGSVTVSYKIQTGAMPQ